MEVIGSDDCDSVDLVACYVFIEENADGDEGSCKDNKEFYGIFYCLFLILMMDILTRMKE
jgi:hypothetical protein